jgi:hypothetical protein
MSGILDKIKQAAGMEQEQSISMLGRQVDEAMTMSWKTRFICFGICLGLGFLLTIISLPLLWSLNLTGFAITYSLGSIVSIASTMFLMGPCKQIQRMLDQNRIIATLIYLAAIVATLVVAFKTGNALLCIICIVIQFAALCWYCITWIPGGQAALKAMIFGV